MEARSSVLAGFAGIDYLGCFCDRLLLAPDALDTLVVSKLFRPRSAVPSPDRVPGTSSPPGTHTGLYLRIGRNSGGPDLARNVERRKRGVHSRRWWRRIVATSSSSRSIFTSKSSTDVGCRAHPRGTLPPSVGLADPLRAARRLDWTSQADSLGLQSDRHSGSFGAVGPEHVERSNPHCQVGPERIGQDQRRPGAERRSLWCSRRVGPARFPDLSARYGISKRPLTTHINQESGERGIRTPEPGCPDYTDSSRAPSAARTPLRRRETSVSPIGVRVMAREAGGWRRGPT